MCKQPIILAPLRGDLPLNSFRNAIKPGISVSAKEISFLPKAAKPISFILKSSDIMKSSFNNIIYPYQGAKAKQIWAKVLLFERL